MLERAGAQFIATPMFEEQEVVKRGVGGSTDIVRKEMFVVHYFGEHGGYVMRPEGTAPIMRSYLQNGLKQFPSPLRLWTYGPMFRAERYQKGRYRQFHQVDYEVIGSADPLVDAEAIQLMVSLLGKLGVRGLRVKLGSIGDPEDRARYNAYLRELFAPVRERLSPISLERLELNPMRILDSKEEQDQQLLEELTPQPMLSFLGVEAQAHFDTVRRYLDAWGVPYDVDPSIVRGLDYYRRTAWEIHHENIGAKSALGGGGRYDGLAVELGGVETPAVGWAFGVERILLALHEEGVVVPERERPLLYVAALDAEYVSVAASIAFAARENGIAEFALQPKKPGKAIQEALRKGARYVAFIGSDEAARGYVSIKDLDTGVQIPVPGVVLDDLLRNRINLVSNNIADIVLEYLLSERNTLNAFRIAQVFFGTALHGALEAWQTTFTHTTPRVAPGPPPTDTETTPRSRHTHDWDLLEKQVKSLWNFIDLEAK